MAKDIISPPDKINDFDVTTMTQAQAMEYRHELWNALWDNVGCEFEVWDDETRAFYNKKLAETDAYLKTFPVQP